MDSGEVTKVTEPLSVGDRVLDRYCVVEKLEKGGTSLVYRAQDERLSRPVCIKVFHTLRKKAGVWRTTYEHFVQEAFTLSRLTHPNTLRIYDFGHLPGPAPEGGPPFQVSEFMHGGTLSQLLREHGPLDVEEVIKVTTAIGGALDEAHVAQIIHRDIKPKNILFSGFGPKRIPKLADFGIAKALELELEYRAGDTRVVAGKRLLMFSGLWAAPEQLSGDQVSAVTDIYSLALVVVYMLTGRCVFSTNEPREAHRQRRRADELIDAALEGYDLPPASARVLKRACAFHPEGRPESAFKFAEALADSLRGDRSRGRRSQSSDTDLVTVPPTLESLPTVPASEPTEKRKRPPHRLTVSTGPQQVAGRTARFVAAAGGTADLVCIGNSRIRLSMIPSPERGFVIHVKGLSCFVELDGGRPTSAVQLKKDGALSLIAKDQSRLARAEVRFGHPAAGHTVFRVGEESIAVGTEECPRVVMLDFGPGAESFLVHTDSQGRPAASAREGKQSK